MSDYPPEPRLLDTREFAVIEVDGKLYTVEEEIWSGAGPTYHVNDENGECVTANDAFEHPPTPDEIRALVEADTAEDAIQPSTGPTYHVFDVNGALVDTVACKFCGKPAPANTAHRHQGGWVGDDCCWDERLRSTE